MHRSRLSMVALLGLYACVHSEDTVHRRTASHEMSAARSIDWRNRTLELENHETVSFQDGSYSELDSEGNCEYCVHILDVSFGDVTGDGNEEALIRVATNLGGVGTTIWAYVFAVSDGIPTLVAQIEGGDRGGGGIQSVSVDGPDVVVRRFDLDDTDGVCCPSRVLVERWRWSSNGLQRQDARTTVERREKNGLLTREWV